MKQISFADAEYAGKRKKTRREVFLDEMEQVVPWKALLKVIERVENEGFRVGLVATIVDRQEGGAETLAAAGYPLRAVFTREQLIGPPETRP